MNVSLAVVILLILIILVLFVWIESASFCVTEYEINTKKNIKKDLKVVFLSDLHDTDTDSFFDRFRRKNRFDGPHKGKNRRLLNAIDSVSPDFVLLAGDMVTSYMQPKYNSDITFEFLKELSDKYKVYYGIGNHEQRYLEDIEKFQGKYEELKSYAESLNISFLENTGEILDEYNVGIYGLLIPMVFYRRVITKHFPEDFVKESLGEADENVFNVLLAHNPDHFEDYVKWKPDLVLSGHVHGGIVSLPPFGGLVSPQLKLFPKYDSGIFKKDESTMILGRGIGWHTVPIRIFNKAEMIVIRINRM